ncbi:kinase-like domain-containing protein [Mycena sp. CBHHK59/15]|nr:kinase-like domain-containing protein [Mycena sp. CBHHK59/15]
MGASIVQISPDKVVKSVCVHATEAFNMEFVRAHTGINVPAVHLVFARAGVTYIVMDYIRGRTVQEAWDSLDGPQRHSVVSQVASALAELRSLPPSTIPGPCGSDGKSKLRGRYFTDYGAGPFRTHHDLAAWLNAKLLVARKTNANAAEGRSAFDGSRALVFTHHDIAPRNLIIDDGGRVWLIDWELSGWYPEYFEYACIVSDVGVPEVRPPTGWNEAILSQMTAYEEEYAMLGSIAWVLDTMPFA